MIAVDTEGSAPDLKRLGPGFIRGTSVCAGVSIAVPGFKTYIPLFHSEDNVDDPEQAIRWLRHSLGGPGLKLGANIHYDMDALNSLGVGLGGDCYDVQVADATIDEEQLSYSLDAIAGRRLGKSKSDAQLKQTLRDVQLEMSQLNELPARYVAEYATEDAALLLEIRDLQLQDVERWGLEEALETEVKLTRVLWDMHQQGIRVDVRRAEQINEQMRAQADQCLAEARRLSSVPLNPDSGKSLAALFDHYRLGYPMTAPSKTYPQGQPSITNDVLKGAGHPVCDMIYQYRRINKIRRDFVQGIFLEHEVSGRIHPQWFQTRSTREGDDEGAQGARTGRITGQKPNLTQIPSRDPELGPLCRSIVLPEEGEQYLKADYSSQEPRITLHFAAVARCSGADRAVAIFQENPKTDYHQMTADLIEERTGVPIGRKPAKGINLGLVYGMGKEKLARQIGVSLDEAEQLFRAYHRGVPYVQEIANKAMDRVQEVGFIRTLGGRVRRFNQWESARYGEMGLFATKEECLETWGSAKRAFAHKALNAAVQGTAADQTKRALIQIASEVRVPLLQVYDEIGMSVGSDEERRRTIEIMETALPLKVPVVADWSVGPNWGFKDD